MENRLSLVAEFDDLVRLRKVLTAGIEPEFLQFVLSQETCRKQWLECEKKCEILDEKVKSLELANATLETKLKHARSGLDNEMKRRQKLEEERNNLMRQIGIVREVLFQDKNTSRMLDDKLAFLSTDFSTHPVSPHKNLSTIDESHATLSPSDVSYDKTEEDIDVAATRGRSKRPSAPPVEDGTPPDKKQRKEKLNAKHHRRSKSAVVTAAEAEESMQPIGGRLKKYNSDSKTNEADDTYRYPNDASTHYPMDVVDLSRTPSWSVASPAMKHYGSVGKSLNRLHSLQQKTVIKPEICNPCNKKIRFGRSVLKCRDCKAACHPECKDLLPLPCIPSTNTPVGIKSGEGCITDYAPSEAPYIPALVVHCVNEIEARGMGEIGLYRVPGAEKEVEELRSKFYRGKGYPNLSQIVDIHVICGCLKSFLRNLKEPLVTYRLWSDFVRAAENPDKDTGLTSTFQAISQLPLPNRDTIAFLMLHLQRVSESESCKMNMSNLAKVFGPTIIGYSLPVQSNPDPMQMITEIKKQQMVMERLLTISSDYWMNFINADDGRKMSYLCTPAQRDISLQEESMLGSTPTGTNTMKTILQKHYLDKMPTKLFDSPL